MNTITPFGLRMQPELKNIALASAKANGRSLNAEIIYQLKRVYGAQNEKAGSPLTA